MTMMAGEISDLVLERGLGSIWLSSFLPKFSMGRRQLWLLTAQLIKCCYETSPACNEKIISFSCIVMIFFVTSWSGFVIWLSQFRWTRQCQSSCIADISYIVHFVKKCPKQTLTNWTHNNSFPVLLYPVYGWTIFPADSSKSIISPSR